MSRHADLLIFYHGAPLILAPGRDMDAQRDTYRLTCPKCGTRGSIVVDPINGHAIVKNVRGGIDITPSLVCGNNCGWHVVVQSSEAGDV